MKEQNQKQEDSEGIVIKKSRIFAVLGAIVMIGFFVFAAQAVFANTGTVQNGNSITGNAAAKAQLQDEKQVVTVTMQGSTYMPNPIRLKKGVPAVLNVDTNSVRGCYRAIQIPTFNVRKVVSASDNKIEFTPDKAGTFGFSCYMGMGRGQIVVEDESGSVPITADATAQVAAAGSAGSGSSCGSSGGCGCGG